MRKQKKWYWWFGLIILVTITGIPVAMIRAIAHLIEGLPRHAIADLLAVPLNWLQIIFVTIPSTLHSDIFTGIGMLLGIIGVLIFCIWLLKRGLDKTN